MTWPGSSPANALASESEPGPLYRERPTGSFGEPTAQGGRPDAVLGYSYFNKSRGARAAVHTDTVNTSRKIVRHIELPGEVSSAAQRGVPVNKDATTSTSARLPTPTRPPPGVQCHGRNSAARAMVHQFVLQISLGARLRPPFGRRRGSMASMSPESRLTETLVMTWRQLFLGREQNGSSPKCGTRRKGTGHCARNVEHDARSRPSDFTSTRSRALCSSMCREGCFEAAH